MEFHVLSTNAMLNLFATTGHNNYAKSTRLYLQSISELQKNQPEVYNESIKQILMKSLKRRAGVVAKRINENVIHVWTKTMCIDVLKSLKLWDSIVSEE